MKLRFDAEALIALRAEVEERYDLFDLINQLNWKLSDLYPYLEEPILDRLDELELLEDPVEWEEDDGRGSEDA